jgi:hypothetical protein
MAVMRAGHSRTMEYAMSSWGEELENNIEALLRLKD